VGGEVVYYDVNDRSNNFNYSSYYLSRSQGLLIYVLNTGN